MAVFNSVLNESNDSSNNASNMISNVSISYNASDPSQRNAIYQAQSKISKSQIRKKNSDDKKELAKMKAGTKIHEDNIDDFPTSIFIESKIIDSVKSKFKFLNKKKEVKKPEKKLAHNISPDNKLLNKNNKPEDKKKNNDKM